MTQERTDLVEGQRVIIKNIPGVTEWNETHEDIGVEDTLTDYRTEYGQEWFTTAKTTWQVRPQDVEPVVEDKSERIEAYSVEEIREAFAKHASEDDWGVPKFYEGTLIAALRGEFDKETD